MDGKTQVTDAPCLFLLRQVVENTILRIKILFNVHFAYVVEKIKIKIFHTASAQLLFKDLLHFSHVGQVIAGEFGGEVITLARILTQAARPITASE